MVLVDKTTLFTREVICVVWPVGWTESSKHAFAFGGLPAKPDDDSEISNTGSDISTNSYNKNATRWQTNRVYFKRIGDNMK